jgi:hypothetical protein
MSARDIITTAWSRVLAQPRLVFVAYLANVALAAPLAAVMYAVLRASMGRGMVAERMRQGWDDLWYRGFQVGADEFARSFKPSVVGVGAPLHAIDDLVTGSLLDLPASIVAAGVAYAIVWVFVSGGLIHRYAHPQSDLGFLSAAARSFGRLLLVVGVGWVAFALVFRYGLRLTNEIAEAATHDSVDERVHFAWAVFKYGTVWIGVMVVRVFVDYAKIVSVLEPAAGVLTAFRRAAGVVRRRVRTVATLVAVVILCQAGLLAVYAVFAPGIAHPNPFMIAIAWGISQTYVLGRIALRSFSVAAHTLVGQRTL